MTQAREPESWLLSNKLHLFSRSRGSSSSRSSSGCFCNRQSTEVSQLLRAFRLCSLLRAFRLCSLLRAFR